MSPKIDNGGFPAPPPGEPVRVVRCSHLACGAETRIRLPTGIPLGAVRRVVCAGCSKPYETATVEELEASTPSRRPRWLDRPPGRRWTLVAIPIAAVAVFEALVLINAVRSDDEDPAQTGSPPPARSVKQPGFSLALPSDWRRERTKGGARFHAVSDDGAGKATLFVRRDPSLSLAEFERRSLVRLQRRSGRARVVDRVTGPTPEKTSVQLRATSAAGTSYEVTLRQSGPFRYYLSTSLARGASPDAVSGAGLIQSSFTPEASTAHSTTGAR